MKLGSEDRSGGVSVVIGGGAVVCTLCVFCCAFRRGIQPNTLLASVPPPYACQYDALNMAPENTGPGPGAYFRDALPSLVSHASTLASAMVATTSRHSGSGLGVSGAQGIAAQHRSPRRRLTQQQQQQQHKARRQQSQMHHSSVLLSLSTASEIPPAAGGLGIGARAVPSTVQTTPVVEFGLARRANQHVYMPHADASRGSGGRPRPPPALCA